jgi:hypothetical protein
MQPDDIASADADELAQLRAENAALRQRVQWLEGVEAGLRYVIEQQRALPAPRRRGRSLDRDPALLLSKPVAGCA